MKAPRLTKAEKERLLERFNEKNAELADFGFCIGIPCILCVKYEPSGCNGCPAKIGRAGCADIVKAVVRGGVTPLQMSKGFISWEETADVSARDDLKRIREYIESCPVWEQTP